MLTRRHLPLALGAIALLAGCATTVPRAQFSKEMTSSLRVSSGDAVKVTVDAGKGVTILPYQQERFTQEIEQDINARKMTNPQLGTGRDYEVDVHVTRYQRGNAFARAMLMGLGQIHIDGNVDVFLMPEHRLLEAFALKKTFAWGGIYGAATSIKVIERTFANGVAAAVTGQQERSPRRRT
jgi:hypothetical protein